MYTVSLTVSGPGGSDTLTQTNYITVTDSVPVLTISKSGPAIATAGEPVTYTLTVTNSGPVTATNLVITDIVPANANYITGGTKVDNVVSWSVPSLTNGSNLSRQFTVTASETITNETYGVAAEGGVGASGSSPVVTLIQSSGAPVSRVTADLRALYLFEEGIGAVVHDVSGVGDALDLTVAAPGNVTWGQGSLSIDAATLIASGVAAGKVIEASKASGEVTIEAWLKPANTSQNGPARIVTLSKNTSYRNFTLGQDGDDYDIRLRSSQTGNLNGMPSVSTAGGSLSTDLTHVVYTRDATGTARIYLDGVEAAEGQILGDLTNWDDTYQLALGNELTNDRAWLGQYNLVALYSRALSAADVQQNYNAGAEYSQAIQVDFSAFPTDGPAPLTVTFANSSTNASTFIWNFGDGTQVTQNSELITQNSFTHTYTQTGVYTVSLTVTGPGGSETLTQVLIHSPLK